MADHEALAVAAKEARLKVMRLRMALRKGAPEEAARLRADVEEAVEAAEAATQAWRKATRPGEVTPAEKRAQRAAEQRQRNEARLAAKARGKAQTVVEMLHPPAEVVAARVESATGAPREGVAALEVALRAALAAETAALARLYPEEQATLLRRYNGDAGAATRVRPQPDYVMTAADSPLRALARREAADLRAILQRMAALNRLTVAMRVANMPEPPSLAAALRMAAA